MRSIDWRQPGQYAIATCAWNARSPSGEKRTSSGTCTPGGTLIVGLVGSWKAVDVPTKERLSITEAGGAVRFSTITVCTAVVPSAIGPKSIVVSEKTAAGVTPRPVSEIPRSGPLLPLWPIRRVDPKSAARSGSNATVNSSDSEGRSDQRMSRSGHSKGWSAGLRRLATVQPSSERRGRQRST